MENEQKENLAEEYGSDARRKSCTTPEAYCDTSRIGDKDGNAAAGQKNRSKWLGGHA